MTYYHDCIWAFIRTTVHLQGGGLKKKTQQSPKFVLVNVR